VQRAVCTLASVIALSACGIGPPSGLLFAHVKGPVTASNESNGYAENGCGESRVVSVFFLLSVGDASVERAKANVSSHPELLHVVSVDYEWTHVLGIGVYKTRVCFYDPGVAPPSGASARDNRGSGG